MKEPLPLRVTRSKDYYSPYLPAPVQNLASGAAADRHVTCVGVKDEAAGIKSFFFRAPPGLRYLPGQYASFEIEVRRMYGYKIFEAISALDLQSCH